MNQIFAELANRDWSWGPPKEEHILWDLEVNNELETLDAVVARVTEHLEKRLLQHTTCEGLPDDVADAAMNRFKLPEKTDREEVEILIHALYTSRFETVDEEGAFHDAPLDDLLKVFALAEKLQMESVLCGIVDLLQMKYHGAMNGSGGIAWTKTFVAALEGNVVALAILADLGIY
ncbi:uncharacterized protein BDZ99DRAFT_456846 [Mytilinidion resinicola]|uniref:BTB domain-containing protein n=1 Tax=Mytilinidion resinicola TaxID=574789 RepID=A0A6A6Z7L0_9PEZI|nr:uncharacterized protein BDZ99DRAFT_456846 [Mytilinidion resinicola]KAF2817046.1 hypothetical protein BDZ99DRAFT_456846 [Mytilinidion resinicola]